MQQFKGMCGTTIRLPSEHKNQVGRLGSIDEEHPAGVEREYDQQHCSNNSYCEPHTTFCRPVPDQCRTSSVVFRILNGPPLSWRLGLEGWVLELKVFYLSFRVVSEAS